MFSRKPKFNNNVLVLSSSSFRDYAINLENDYEKASTVKVIDQGSAIKDKLGIPSLIKPISNKWII